MDITSNLVIMNQPHERYPGKPFFLYIAGNGPVGDKLNMGAGYAGSRFPVDASERMATLEGAIDTYEKFLYYVQDKIKQASKQPSHEDKKKPSYYSWT